jgi:hypothetical protein
MRGGQDICHKNYPSTIVSENPLTRKFFKQIKAPITEMNVYTYKVKKECELKKKDFQSEHLDILIYPRTYKNNLNLPHNFLGKLKLPPHLFRIRLKALRIIFLEIEEHYASRCFRSISGLPLNLFSVGECPYRLALSFWFHYILSDWKEQKWFFNEYKNSTYGTNIASLFPDPVSPVKYLKIDNDLYSIPKEAQSQIYLNDLLELYKIFYHYFKNYMQTISDYDGKRVHFDTIKYRCNIDSSTGSNIATVLEKNKLKVYIPVRDEPGNFKLKSFQLKSQNKEFCDPSEKLYFGLEKKSFQKLRKIRSFSF